MELFINHKSKLSLEEIKTYEIELRELNVVVFPSICYLSMFQNGNYILGSQDINESEHDDRTGEINSKQLKSLDVKYCIVGHRDRRIYKKEKIRTLLNKVNNCIINNITPLYCLGENFILNKIEINEIMKLVKDKEIIFVYEPYKNIGQNNPNISSLENKINQIKKYILKKYNKKAKIIYGGGINLNNIEKIKKYKNVDGIILSTSSLEIEQVKQIYNIIK